MLAVCHSEVTAYVLVLVLITMATCLVDNQPEWLWPLFQNEDHITEHNDACALVKNDVFLIAKFAIGGILASNREMSEQEVKDNIKSIITSNPLISTIQTVQKDYKEIIGTPIPFHKFNYNSLEHFLKNIPDTCVVNGTGSYAQVTLIPSKKSAHINEMVIQQKTTVKGRRKCMAPRRRHTTGFTVQSVRRPNSFQPPRYNYSFSPNTSLSSSSSLGNTSPASNYFTRTNSSTNGQTWTRNTTIYNNGAEVKNTNVQNTSMGQGAVNNLVRVRSDGCRTENTEEKRNHILEQNRLESRNIKERLETLMQQQVKLGNVVKTPPPSTAKFQEPEPCNKSTNNFNFMTPDNAPVIDHTSLSTLNINGNGSRQEYSKESSVTNEDIYFNNSKEKLNNLLYNFKSVDEEFDEDTSNVPKRVQCNLRTLISQFSEGIWCSDVPNHYQKLFKKELMYMEYGYTGLIEMCVALKHIFHYVRPGRDDFKLYDRKKPLPDNVEKTYTMASFDLGGKVPTTDALPELDWDDFIGHIPDDVVKFGHEIPNEFLPKDTRVESILDVVVVEIYDPSKFWFYLGTSFNTPLDDLMEEMQTFYRNSENAREYAIPSGALKEGLYCVQLIYGDYHRARIVRMQTDCPDSVRVLYIDYGTVCKASIKGMCFLHEKFGELNAQAIRCRLANIVPKLKGHPWPRTTSNRFREVVNRRDTKIKVSYIDWNEEYVCVFLADVTDPDNVLYINETLVNEGHAVWEGETQVIPFTLPNFKCKVQNIHLFPTFLELEYGLAPNASEMYALSDLLMPLQFCIPPYFEPMDGLLATDEDIEQIENSFLETIKNHRKSNISFLSMIDVKTIIDPPPIDFDIFGDLKDEMIRFCDRIKEEGQQVQIKEQQEDKLFCDVDEAAGNTLELFKALDRDLKECEPLRMMKEDRELSESIIEKLKNCSLVDLEHSSNSESESVGSLETRKSATTPKSANSDSGWLSPEEIIENDLSTIYEHSDMEVETADTTPAESPKRQYFGFGLNVAQSRSDINIFDNPEEFDGASDTPETSDAGSRPVSPESFLRTVERFCKPDAKEDIELLEEGNNSTTDNSSTVCTDSENPFKFDINADLTEAFKTFLQAQKKVSSDSGCEQSPNVSNQHEQLPLLRMDSSCEESFLKSNSLKLKEKAAKVGERKENDLRREGSTKTDNSNTDSPLKTKLEETRDSFVSTLSLNNPFRPYLECKSSENTDYLSTVGTDNEDLAATTATIQTDTETLSAKTSVKLSHTEAQTASARTSDSDSSDYKVFVPTKLGTRYGGATNQEACGSWVQNSMTARGMSTPPNIATPPRICTPPRLFTPPACVPMGYPPYPQWSNGSGYPVPQYHQWSNGGNYPGPNGFFAPPQHPGYGPPPPRESFGYGPPPPRESFVPVARDSFGPPPRGMLRPPPGFGPQGPPQGYHPYMGPPVAPGPPVFHHQGPPMYYGPPRHPPVPHVITERDFYERYNKGIMKQPTEPS